MKVLALIPARGGSKGIVRKNLAELAGRPLIAWTIVPAVACQAEGTLTRVVVSTDDPEIAEVSAGHGAEVPFLRPAALADDTAKTVDVVMHALDFFAASGEVFDAVMLLQPTSPLRTQEDIRRAAGLFADRKAEREITGKKRNSKLMYILLGCVIALPILVIVLNLLSSADPVFAKVIKDIFGKLFFM